MKHPEMSIQAQEKHSKIRQYLKKSYSSIDLKVRFEMSGTKEHKNMNTNVSRKGKNHACKLKLTKLYIHF